MASVSVMQIEPAQSELVHQRAPLISGLDYGRQVTANEDQNVTRGGHAHWTTGYSSGYTSSSSSMQSPTIQAGRSHTLDIDQALERSSLTMEGNATRWTPGNRGGVTNRCDEGQRDSLASEWSRDGAVSGWSTRREYSRSDEYRPQVLTLLPLHRLRGEGPYSRLDHSGSTTPSHSRQSSRTSTHSNTRDSSTTPTPQRFSPQGDIPHAAALTDHPLHRNSTSLPPFQGNHTSNHASHHSSQGFDYNPHPPLDSQRFNTQFHGSNSQLENFDFSTPEQLPWTTSQNGSYPVPSHAHQTSLDNTIQTSSSYFIEEARPHTEGHSPFTVPPSSRAKSAATASDKSLVACVLEKLEEVDVDVKRWVVKADRHLQRSEYKEAIPYVEAVIVRMQPYHRLQLLLWELLGNTHMAVSNWKKASICHLHHLGYSRALRDFKSVTRAECNLGISYLKLGLLKLADRCFHQYLQNCKTLRDDWGVQAACSNLGVLSKLAATKAYETAQNSSSDGRRERGGVETSTRANLNSGILKAIIFFKQHLEIVSDYGDVDKQSRAHGNIGSCYELLRDYNEAIHHHKKRLELSRATGDLHSESCTLCHLGNCLRAKGSYEEALEYYQMNLEMCQSLEDLKMEEILHFNMGLTFEKMKQPHQAITHYTLYLGLVADSGQLEKQVRGFSVLARLYVETEQLPKAQEYYHNLVGIFKKLGDFSSMGQAQLKSKSLLHLIKMEKKRAKKTDGRHSYSPAHARHRKSKTRASKVHTISRATNIHRELGGKHSGENGRCHPAHDRVGYSWDGADHDSNPIRRENNTMGRKEHTLRHVTNHSGPNAMETSVDHNYTRERARHEVGYESVRVTKDSPVSFSSSRQSQTSYNSRSCDYLHRRGNPLELHEDTPPVPPRMIPPVPSQASCASARDRSISLDTGSALDTSIGGHYNHLATPTAVDYNNTADNFTSVTSISMENMDSIAASESSRHPANLPVLSVQVQEEEIASNGGDSSTLYETISQDSREDGSLGDHLANLPALSYFPSTLGFGVDDTDAQDLIPMADRHVEEGSQGNSGDISQRHYQELKEAGLELARVGLGLAGYEAEMALDGLNLEDGMDKEWEQWRQMKEEDIKHGVDFGSSGHSTMQRKMKRNLLLKTSGSAPALANKLS